MNPEIKRLEDTKEELKTECKKAIELQRTWEAYLALIVPVLKEHPQWNAGHAEGNLRARGVPIDQIIDELPNELKYEIDLDDEGTPEQWVEAKENEKYFLTQLDSLLPDHEGQAVLIHNQEFIEFYDEFMDAFYVGYARYPDGMYSVQEVTKTPQYIKRNKWH